MSEEFFAIFLGNHTVTKPLKMRKEDNKLYFLMPSLVRDFWVAIHHNTKDFEDKLKCYEERKLFSVKDGRTEQTLRIYFFDFDSLEPYFPNMNQSALRELENLRQQRDTYFSLCKEYENTLQQYAGHDLSKQKMKKEYDFYANLKPPQLYDQDKDKKEKSKSSK